MYPSYSVDLSLELIGQSDTACQSVIATELETSLGQFIADPCPSLGSVVTSAYTITVTASVTVEASKVSVLNVFAVCLRRFSLLSMTGNDMDLSPLTCNL